MRGSLSDNESRAQPATHGFGNSDDMVSAGCRVPGCAVVIRTAVSTEIELLEFGPVAVPLKHDRFGPVMPDWRTNNQVRVNEKAARIGQRGGIVREDRQQSTHAEQAVDAEVLAQK